MSTTSRPEHGDDHVPTEELIRRQGVKPLPPLDQLPWDDPFSSDEEYAEFLRDLYASRRHSWAFVLDTDVASALIRCGPAQAP